MTYSSVFFLFFFLPVFIGIYAIANARHRVKILILGSAAFIAWASPWGLINLAVSVLSAYLGGIFIYNLRDSKARSRAALWSCISLNVIMFIIFADGLFGEALERSFYAAFGICVYAFHSISYCADVYMKKIEPDVQFSSVCAYVGFMPSLARGPLLKYEELSQQLRAPSIKSDMLSDGIMMFLIGLAEKVILADQLETLCRDIFSLQTNEMSSMTAWLGAIIFGFRFYYEFQSFSHMARGFALMLGFEIKPNFDFPYSKLSVTDFLKCFNVSLIGWINDYIYQPLGGNKRTVPMLLRNIFLSVTAMSLWYGFGLNFLFWALYLLVFVIAETFMKKKLQRIPMVIRFISVNVIMLVGWAVLFEKNLFASLKYIGVMFSGGIFLVDELSLYFAKNSAVILLICIIFASPLLKFMHSRSDSVKSIAVTASKPAIILALMILCTAFMLFGNSASAFVF